MAKIHPESAYAKVVFNGFPGIDREKERKGDQAAEEMTNFRPCPDGSLKKRCGYRPILTLPGTPRAVFSGEVNGNEEFWFVIDNRVYRMSDDFEDGYEICAFLGTSSGDAQFVAFESRFYLFDGDSIYERTSDGLSRAEGYIPLYGDRWDPSELGEVNESENRLTPRVQIRYYNPGGESVLNFGRAVSGIDKVFLDGVESDAPVSLIRGRFAAESSAFAESEVIDLVVTFAGTVTGTSPAACRRAFVYGGALDNRLFVWDGSDKTEFFMSRPVDPDRAARSAIAGRSPAGARLYFPSDQPSYHVTSPMTAVCRHFDRLLVFTANAAWAVDCGSGSDFTVLPVHSSVGCDRKDCAVLCGNTPVTFCGGKLWKWSARTGARNECSAEVISDPIRDRIAELQNKVVTIQYYRAREELWVASPDDRDGRVWIYHTGYGRFYSFDGIGAERLIASGDEPKFISDEIFFGFDESADTDRYGDEITAFYRSGWMDFGHPERKKHFSGFLLEGKCDGDGITVGFESESCVSKTVGLTGDKKPVSEAYGCRVPFGRFRYLQVTLTAGGKGRQELHTLCLTARK